MIHTREYTVQGLVKESAAVQMADEFDLAVVIPARDEAAVLKGTLEALLASIKRRDQIHVIADHCMDETEAVAAGAGVCLHIRNNGGPVGKGPALHWWLTRTHAQALPHQIVLVLDADSLIRPGFIEGLRAAFNDGIVAAQTRIEPLSDSKSAVSLLASFSEIVEHRIFDSMRGKVGWPVRLRGTGMAFRRGTLEDYSARLHTATEDLELTLLLGAAGVPIHYLPDVVVMDPKPPDPGGAIHQRARWIKGQIQVMSSYPGQLLRLILRGPKGWSLFSSAFLKPKTLILPFKAAVVAGWIILAMGQGSLRMMWAGLAALGITTIFIDLAAFLLSLRYTRHPRSTLVALLSSPTYLLLWLKSLAVARLQGQRWLRSRPLVLDRVLGKTSSLR